MKDKHLLQTNVSNPDQLLKNNQQAWNELASQNHPLTRPANEKDMSSPLTLVDSSHWLDRTKGTKDKPLLGQRVLCLAAGGGKHSVLYTQLGGDVTVVDLSAAMIEKDIKIRRERNLKFETHVASMHDLSFLPAFHDDKEKFDLVIHPVSSCYYHDLNEVYAQVARVMRIGGLYIVQHKQPINMQTGFSTNRDGHYTLSFPYENGLPITPPKVKTSDPTLHASYKLRETGTQEHLHTWTAMISSLCRNGFVIEDLSEPRHGDINSPATSFRHRCAYAPPYVRLKARRIDQNPTSEGDKPSLAKWIF